MRSATYSPGARFFPSNSSCTVLSPARRVKVWDPEEGLVAEKSVNADIVRFRIYQNQNIFFDGTIDQEGNTVQVTIPEGIDKSAIRPQVLVSAGAVVTPKSGELQDFTNPVEYKVVSENGENTKTYMITVNY